MTDEPRRPVEPILLPGEGRGADSGFQAVPGRPPGEGGGQFPGAPARRRPRWRLPLVLFLLSCASTFYAGIGQFGIPEMEIDPATGKKVPVVVVDPATRRATLTIDWRQTLLNGLTYAIAVMVMLAAHEAGHYLQARRYHVPASLPLFIPMPFGDLGTMGAIIFQQPGVADRRSLFDIAITGPLAGLAVALPLNWWGIQHSELVQIRPGSGGWTNPRIVEWMIAWIHRPLQPGEDIALNPILFAGWVGIFITALNLVPIGQLDGGHILFCLIGRKAHRVARVLYLGAVAIVVYQLMRGHYEYVAWPLMLILVWFMGTEHPPTANDQMPLGITRTILGWLTLTFILVGFVPTPMYTVPPPAEKNAPVQQAPEIVGPRGGELNIEDR
ncbi:MAG: site-2 protease family protein [Deltaproteobacteria bacterium]